MHVARCTLRVGGGRAGAAVIDLHTHLLPDIDDGSRSVVQSVEVLRDFHADGVEEVVLTPHILASQIERELDEHLERRERALGGLAGRAPPLPRLHIGYEIMLDQPLPELAVGDRRLSLAGSRYYLVEFTLGVVPEFARTVLEQIVRAGVVPLVAHPERYDACSEPVVRAWREVGARTLLDAGALARPGRRGERARQLLRVGLGDAVASDNHGDGRSVLRTPRFLSERAEGSPSHVDRVASLLTVENPGAVIEDREMVEVPPLQFREGLIGKLRRVIEG